MSHAPFEPETFTAGSKAALGDARLASAVKHATTLLTNARTQARQNLPEFDALRDFAVKLRNEHLADLPNLLQTFESRVMERGGSVFWASTPRAACNEIIRICDVAGAKTIVKSKSMVSEEVGLNHALTRAGFELIETDLGEYIIQLRDEKPSHIIGPALHLRKADIVATFRDAHTDLDARRPLEERRDLVREARQVLRQKFAEADVGITGANFLIADTGSIVLVTNEGNADLTANLPRTHIVLVGIEKVVRDFSDAAVLLRLLGRSATGQEMTAYTSVLSGPRQGGDQEGPDSFHVILLDNGRSGFVGTDMQDMLRCIRCGACLNHCPVYAAIGGHAYGSVYSGPMGAVLTPAMTSATQAASLPSASTFCGKCEEVCPVRIPLPSLMRKWRERKFTATHEVSLMGIALRVWGWVCREPRRYIAVTSLLNRVIRFWGPGPTISRLVGPGAKWTDSRDFAKPSATSFQSQICRSPHE